MASRITPFINGHYYHVFNRGVEKRIIFLDKWDYYRFLNTLNFYNDLENRCRFSWGEKRKATIKPMSSRVDISAFCLMPNHFHLLLRQNQENGITKLLSKVSNSYTKYFNTKRKRVGPLLQGPFRSVHIESDEQLIHVTRYIHLNPFVKSTRSISEFSFPYSSYNEYLKESSAYEIGFLKDIIGGTEKFVKFHQEHIEYAQHLEYLKHFDNPHDD